MSPLHALERGSGRPLVLLHGIGSAHSAWEPVLDTLAADRRRVIAYDLPGFGESPPLPAGVEPTPLALGEAVLEDLRARGIDPPVDFAGNSLGGRIALELAKLGHARSVVALSPGGLWPGDAPPLVRIKLRGNREAAKRFAKLVPWLLRSRAGRTFVLGGVGPIKGWRVPYDAALEAVTNFTRGDAFEAVLDAAGPRFEGGSAITVPVTIAFGRYDWLLTHRSAQHRGELPAQTRWGTIPRAGHVPMWDAPDEVAQILLEGSSLTTGQNGP